MTCFFNVRAKHFNLRDFSMFFYNIEFKWFFITTATVIRHKRKGSELYPLYFAPHPMAVAATGNLFQYGGSIQMYCAHAPFIIGPGA